MNLYIMVDLEGISGICSRDQIFGDRISEGKLLMTEDINACVNAAKEAGVEVSEILGAEFVCAIGRKVVLYRRSLSDKITHIEF